MINVADLFITSLDVIKAYTLAGMPRFILDELQETNIANSEDKADVTGKGGRKIGSLKRNKGVTVTGANGLLSAGMLEAQTGGRFVENNAAPVEWVDYLIVSGNAAKTEYKAVGTTGAEIAAVYVRNSNGAAGKKLTQAAAVAEGKFTYDPETMGLAFNQGEVADGAEIIVFYTRHVAANVLENASDTYSERLRVFIDATAEDKCGNVYHAQFYMPRADFNGNFEIQLGGDQAVHNFEFESLAGSCGASGNLWTYTIFGVNAEDAA